VRFLEVLRYAVFVIFLGGAAIALAANAVRKRQVNPFSPLGRALRGISEPFVRPMERWIASRGGNPQNAGFWIFGLTVVGGILIIGTANWLVTQVAVARAMSTSGTGTVRLILRYAIRLLQLALLLRIIASFFGQFQYSRWARPAYILTDWLVQPLRRIIPQMGPFDLSVLVAWLLLSLIAGAI
jgi:YggT family protein